MKRFCSVFQQILKLFPRLEFEGLVREHRAERHARGFRRFRLGEIPPDKGRGQVSHVGGLPIGDHAVARQVAVVVENHAAQRSMVEASMTRQMSFPFGSIVVFDRGYNDYLWFTELTVTDVDLVEERAVRCGSGVRADQIVHLVTGIAEVDQDPVRFRRIEFTDSEGKDFVFLTNRLDLSAATIAEIYRQRWQIEIIFKLLKQNLRIKTFVGTSSNALHIQLWTALIAILILKYMQLRSRYGWALSNLIAMIRLNLFTYRDLWVWLDDLFTPPEIPPEDESVQLTLVHFGQQDGGVVM